MRITLPRYRENGFSEWQWGFHLEHSSWFQKLGTWAMVGLDLRILLLSIIGSNSVFWNCKLTVVEQLSTHNSMICMQHKAIVFAYFGLQLCTKQISMACFDKIWLNFPPYCGCVYKCSWNSIKTLCWYNLRTIINN